VHTLNEGTVEYKEMGMEELIKDLDIPGIVSMFGQQESTDKSRGNFQRNFGLSCGQNVGPSETDEDTVKFSGCTHPRLNKDSKHPSVTKAFDIGWKVGQKMGIDYCQDGFLKENPWAQPSFDFVEHLIGKHGFAAMSLCLLDEDEDHRVTHHTDDENDPRLSAVLNITMLLYLDGSWVRASLIFYMRKSISDMCLRQQVCSEIADQCSRFVSGCVASGETYRLPSLPHQDPEEDVKNYFENFVGCEGMIVTVERKTNLIVSAALRSKASANKQGNFLSSVAFALIHL
jgi:hypothetical protein